MTQRAPAGPFYGWRMVALAFVAFNIGLTVPVNSFGPALPALQREVQASRTGISLAFGLMMLSMGLMAPVVGNLAQRFSLRALMMTGALLNGCGFVLLAYGATLWQIDIAYGLMIGPGACAMALISSPTLISRWFEQDRGKALGLGLVQVFALVTAPASALLLSVGGRTVLFVAIAALFALAVPVMSRVIDWPAQVDQAPRRSAAAHVSGTGLGAVKSSREIFTGGRFWLLSIAVGIYSAAGVTLGSHGPAMAVAKGLPPALASTLLAATGAGTLFGAFGFGWLIDRLGPFWALLVALIFTSAAWLVFANLTTLPALASLTFFMGVNMGPTQALHSACLSEIVGAASFGRAMGYSYFIKLPFLFGAAPLAGMLYDRTGGYGSTYHVIGAAVAIAAAMAAALGLANHRHSQRVMQVPA